MQEEPHPSELNILQKYNCAVKLATKTSRLKNKDWYRDALDLEVQVHCFMANNGEANCYLHRVSTGLYETLGKLSSHQLEKYEELDRFVEYVLALEQTKGAKSLGVVMHLTDEMSLATLSPDFQNREELDEIKLLMETSPNEVLGDKTVSTETHAWKLFPYPGAEEGSEFATAVAVSRRYESTLKIFRQIGEAMNLPIRTAGLCTPLCALASQPLFSAAKDIGTITIVSYQKFTLLGFYNKAFELLLIRYMPHANGASAPANIGPAVLATSTALELETPLIQLLPMGKQDLDPAIVALQGSMMGSEIVLVDSNEIMKGGDIPAGIPLELLISTQILDSENYPLVGNETFGSYQSDKWHSQDFLSPAPEELAMSPTKKDMNLLKLGRYLKQLAAILLISFIVFAGFGIWKKIKSPAWQHQQGKSSSMMDALSKKDESYVRLENLLKDRSKAWVNMELIARLIPDNSSIVLTKVDHTAGLIAGKQDKRGLRKQWKIDGYTNEKDLEYLFKLSTREGVAALFKEVAVATGNSAYLPDIPSRDLTIALTQKKNTAKRESSLGYSFTLVIGQTFTAKDEHAISVLSAKKKPNAKPKPRIGK